MVGGHSIDDPEPKYGLAVVGLADPDRLLTIARARPGDRLVLTKPLGTGVVATAIKRGDPDPAVVAAAVAAMTTLNHDAAEAALAAGVEAATDVTGFGLLGHLHRMLRASGVAAQVDAARVPFLPGAAELAGAGFVSGGTRNNQAYLRDHVELEQGLPPVVATLLHDAQTSGGLLLAVAPERLGGLVADLRGRGIEPAVIGRVLDGPAGPDRGAAAARLRAGAAMVGASPDCYPRSPGGRRCCGSTTTSTQALVAHARAEYPNEACALLGGRDGSVERVYALPNAEASPTFYVVEPKAQLRAMTEMDDLGLDLVGIFHSHVATEAYPSRTDVELAAYPDAVYLILSLADQDAPVLRAFRIRDGRVDEEELERRTAGVAG